ncbi:ureidoglycolate lyase [Pontiella sulfatireligans]|uniref:Ureidoglycolate lyase n=1 Tax=Pontiella sulfatireligans TaxID=2750658 RepID=A0A6C2UPS5_9BACT|nr:ureidoglycolate lyase [Pontiella sulfatireligans]VGO22208.1 hypothetical protein SCARR_04290 [Pontiella sulfatireligans]
MKAKIETITKEAFSKYGQVIEMPIKTEPTIAVPTVNFWKQQAFLAIDGDVEVGVLNIKKMDMVYDDLENHFETQTGLISLTGDWAIGVATPSDAVPKAEDMKAFRVAKNQLVVLADKCWHTAPFAVDIEENIMLVICKKDFLDNDTVYEKIDQPGELVF